MCRYQFCNMESLPLIPGYTFHDPSIREYKLGHKCDILNGFRVLRDSKFGIGARPTDAASLAYIKNEDTIQYDPSLTYGRIREYGFQQYVPHHVLFAQKCLSFKAFFQQSVFNSPMEHFRVRHVNIIYFLEDDTLSVIEPIVENAGFQQGKLVKRGKITKNLTDFFHWKDLNVGIDICIYGVIYHIVDCDLFTREFLSSQGIDVGDTEESPPDPYLQFHANKSKVPIRIVKTIDDTRRRFLEYDSMVLSFNATWNNDIYQILYFLIDDTIAIREIHKPNNGKDPVAALLKRMKIPKNWKHLPSSYPGIYLKYGDPEVIEYYTPKDFEIGKTVFVFGRRFLLHDCDAFTRKYYSNMLKIQQPERIPLCIEETKSDIKSEMFKNNISFIAKPAKKNLIRQLSTFPKKLRYSMKMDAVHPEDMNRDFIMEYSLSEGTLLITEVPKDNSGRREGCFLLPTLVPKSSTLRDNPLYYTPQDFFIGTKINIFNHYFIINGADLFVYRYMEANSDKFSQEIRDNMRNYFMKEGLLKDDVITKANTIENIENITDNIEAPIEKPFQDTLSTDSSILESKNAIERKDESGYDTMKRSTLPSGKFCSRLIATDHSTDATTPQIIEKSKKELKWMDQVQ